MRNGDVEVDRGILDEPDLRIVADYANTLPLARMVFADDPELAEEAQRLVAQATAEGKMRREGDGTAMASLPWAGKLHDVLAKRTA